MGPRTIEKKAFGARMRALRLERKLTYSAMAELLDLSVPMILKYERGFSFPSAETLRIIVQRLEVSSDSLLGLNVVPIGRVPKKS
jgi:transcriptional regulator with XRE-family HTH domain